MSKLKKLYRTSRQIRQGRYIEIYTAFLLTLTFAIQKYFGYVKFDVWELFYPFYVLFSYYLFVVVLAITLHYVRGKKD